MQIRIWLKATRGWMTSATGEVRGAQPWHSWLLRWGIVARVTAGCSQGKGRWSMEGACQVEGATAGKAVVGAVASAHGASRGSTVEVTVRAEVGTLREAANQGRAAARD